MLLSKDTDILFDSFVNKFLEQYNTFHVISEETEDPDDIDGGEEDDDAGYDIESDDPSSSPQVKAVKDRSSEEEKEIVTFNELYPEKLSPEEITQLFIKIEDYERLLLQTFGRIKFSAYKMRDMFKDLIAGKTTVSALKHKREAAAYRRWSSNPDYVRYIRNNLPRIDDIIDDIQQKLGSYTDMREVSLLKDSLEEIFNKTNLSQVIINKLADETLQFLDEKLKDNQNILEDSWVQPEQLQVARDAVFTYQKTYNDARHTVRLHNMRLVAKIAIETKNSLAMLGYSQNNFVQELVSAGDEGLVEAIDRFDYKRRNKFSTAAVPYIRAAIKIYNYKNNRISVDAKTITQLSRVRKAQRDLEQDLRRKPTIEEIADFINKKESSFKPTVYQIRELLSTPTTTSLDMSVGEHGSETVGSRAEDVTTPHAGSFENEVIFMRQKISGIIDKLTNEEHTTVQHFFDLENFNVDKFKSQILAVREHFLNMSKKINDSFDNEINKFLSLYLEITTTTPVNAITNVGQQALTINPSDMTGKADCPISIAAYEIYNMHKRNKEPGASKTPPTPWDQLSDEQRKAYVDLIQAEQKLSNKSATNPAVTRPTTPSNQQAQSSATSSSATPVRALGAI